ncbi:MAG: WbqC family protein [Bacteroidetes bacterium]|nr:WbqC family protein [Bacteroidota bacterium]
MDIKKSEQVIVESHVLPCVNQFRKMAHADVVYIDLHQRFEKQTYRNRYYIATAQGKFPMIVPVQQGKTKLSMKDVQISYADHWQRNHIKTIKSAYGSSPYFIYFIDEFESVYMEQKKYLYEWNNNLLLWLFKQFKILSEVSLIVDPEHYTILKASPKIVEPTAKIETTDLRNLYTIQNTDEVAEPYMQVFSETTGFLPHLSILDYLFNIGNNIK